MADMTDDEILDLWSGPGNRPTMGRNKIIGFARAVLAAAVPPGYVVVPREPTVGMCIAGDAARHNEDDATRTPAIYRAMINAAPETKP